MSKQFTNQELKKLIHNLYIENLFTINEDIEKLIYKSSKVRYETLLNHYNEIKNIIVEKLIKSENSSNTNENIEIKEIEIQTNNIETQTDLFEIIQNDKDLFKKNFKLNQELNDYKFKYENLKKEFKQFRKFTNDSKNNNNKNYISQSSDEEIKEHRKIPYNQLPEMSSFNLIQQLSKLSKHELKTIYNKYFSSKLQRQFSIYK